TRSSRSERRPSMRSHQDGYIQHVMMDSMSELFDMVLERTGSNCVDPQNAELARTVWEYSKNEAVAAAESYSDPSHADMETSVNEVKEAIRAELHKIGVLRTKPKRHIARR